MPEVTEKKKSSESAAPAPGTSPAKEKAPGLQFRRLFTKPGISPYDEIEWDLRVAQITDGQGNVIFEQKDVEVPKDWSMTATNIVASKYLHGTIGTPERETGVRQLVARVAETIRDWGKADGYFRSDEDAAVLGLLHQLGQRLARFYFDPGQDRGHAVQVGQRHGHEPVAAALLDRGPERRRHRQRPAEFHERL